MKKFNAQNEELNQKEGSTFKKIPSSLQVSSEESIENQSNFDNEGTVPEIIGPDIREKLADKKEVVASPREKATEKNSMSENLVRSSSKTSISQHFGNALKNMTKFSKAGNQSQDLEIDQPADYDSFRPKSKNPVECIRSKTLGNSEENFMPIFEPKCTDSTSDSEDRMRAMKTPAGRDSFKHPEYSHINVDKKIKKTEMDELMSELEALNSLVSSIAEETLKFDNNESEFQKKISKVNEKYYPKVDEKFEKEVDDICKRMYNRPTTHKQNSQVPFLILH